MSGALRLTARPHASLPTGTPAWTEEGTTYLDWPWFVADERQRARILRHEAIHRIQQRHAPRGESSAHRTRAEAVAATGALAPFSISPGELQHPVPRLLAAPPQTFSPWTRVWIGAPGIIAEIEGGSIVVRLFLSYADIGISGALPHRSFMCSSHDSPDFPGLAGKMQAVAAQVARMNTFIADAAAAARIALVCIYSEPQNERQSRLRTANGKGALILSRVDFNNGVADDTIAHEGAHAVLEAHMLRGESGPREPSPLVLRFADLYVRLQATKSVPLPTARFDPNAPPDLAPAQESASDAQSLQPAGIVMVTDTLWGEPGGHPWDNVDEFFASAFAGFVQQPIRFGRAIDYYATADPAIEPLRKELLDLLATAKDPARAGALTPPEDSAAAQSALGGLDAPVDMTGLTEPAELGWLVDPITLPSPPDRELTCRSMPSEEEVLKSDDLP